MDRPDHQRLCNLLQARHSCVVIQTFEEEYAIEVINESSLECHKDVAMWTVSRGLRDGLLAGAEGDKDTEHPAAALDMIARAGQRGKVYVLLDLVPHLGDARTLRMLRDAIDAAEDRHFAVVLVEAASDLPPVLTAFAARMELTYPGEEELHHLIRDTLRKLNEERRVNVQIDRHQLNTIIRNLRGLTRRQVVRAIHDVVAVDRLLNADDVVRLLHYKRETLGGTGLLEYVEAPLSMQDIGGLSRLKAWLEARKNSLDERAVQFGVSPPRGLLLLGVQGGGKSLAAKAVATAWHRPLLRMDAGALYDKFIGESERRLRDALKQAEMMAPVVLWIDEIEKAFASAGSGSNDGGLSRRMFGSLLTWMQEHKAPVFLIATANDIESLPPELLRKGRFDEIFFVDLPDDDARRAIFEIHLRRRDRNPADFDLPPLVEASRGYSGAEIEQAIKDALVDAYSDNAQLSTARVKTAVEQTTPLSVTMQEKIAYLRHWASTRCTPAE